MKETIGNSHYQEKVSCLIEFAAPIFLFFFSSHVTLLVILAVPGQI